MRLFGRDPEEIASMMAWKLEPKPEAMTRIRHGELSWLGILEKYKHNMRELLVSGFRVSNQSSSSFKTFPLQRLSRDADSGRHTIVQKMI